MVYSINKIFSNLVYVEPILILYSVYIYNIFATMYCLQLPKVEEHKIDKQKFQKKEEGR